jgi:hypothetical protein
VAAIADAVPAPHVNLIKLANAHRELYAEEIDGVATFLHIFFWSNGQLFS